jgi:hypothetical protein
VSNKGPQNFWRYGLDAYGVVLCGQVNEGGSGNERPGEVFQDEECDGTMWSYRDTPHIILHPGKPAKLSGMLK